LCRSLGAAGCRVAVLDLNGDAVTSFSDTLRSEGIEAIGVACDVTDTTACDRAVAAVTEAFGGIDVLCCNAGVTQISTFVDTDIPVYRAVMDVNFFGAVHMTRAAIPSLADRRGIIAVTSSIAGFAPLYARTAYSASKHALHGFYNTLRVELRDEGVDVLLVCPGFTRTAIRILGGDGGDADMRRHLKGGEAEPERVAEQIRRAIVRRRRLAILTPAGRLAWLLTRLAPRLYDRLMLKRVGSA
jgi:NAD(P)-dependent dehydrogenase (short-subunit alcohol dehydrogenase family)